MKSKVLEEYITLYYPLLRVQVLSSRTHQASSVFWLCCHSIIPRQCVTIVTVDSTLIRPHDRSRHEGLASATYSLKILLGRQLGGHYEQARSTLCYSSGIGEARRSDNGQRRVPNSQEQSVEISFVGHRSVSRRFGEARPKHLYRVHPSRTL